MSFSKNLIKRIEAGKRQNIYLIHGEDNGLKCWYFLLIDDLKLPILKAKMKSLPEDMELNNFGRIIKSGWGESPPDSVREKIDSGDFEFEEPGSGYEIFHVEPTTPDGKKFYAFIAVPEPLAEKFNYLMNKDGSNMNLHEWGKVLKWGWGKASSDKALELRNLYKLKQHS